MLHVLFVLLHGPLSIPVICKRDKRIPRRSPFVVVPDLDVNGVGNGAEPFVDLILGHSEGETPHLDGGARSTTTPATSIATTISTTPIATAWGATTISTSWAYRQGLTFVLGHIR